jgi:Immunity protein 35
MTEEQALNLVKRYVAEKASGSGVEMLVMEDETMTTEFGWVFFYNTRAYIEDGDEMAIIVGAAPEIVDKTSGKLEVAGTAYPIEYYIEMYKRHGTCHPERLK